jgi:hypothetical protein
MFLLYLLPSWDSWTPFKRLWDILFVMRSCQQESTIIDPSGRKQATKKNKGTQGHTLQKEQKMDPTS